MAFLFILSQSWINFPGALPNAEDEKLGTPLTLALQQGHEDFAMWLIEKYQLSCDQQGTSLEKTTPLHKVEGGFGCVD